MALTSQPALLTQAEFDDYAAAWQTAIKGPLPELAALFQGTTRLLSATLPLDQVLHLLSAVGVRRLKVGFVVRPAVLADESPFTLALYATDAADNRLSAYYLARTPWGAVPASGSPGPVVGTPVPLKLATLWQQQWTAAPAIEAAFFQVPAGPLQGYDFEVRDVVDALLAVPQLDDKQLVFGFGLHEFFGPDAPATPGLTRTFGLALYVADGYGTLASAPYDMALPRPPAP